MPQNTYLLTIINAFSTFDLESHQTLLKRKVYQDNTKEIFLKELESKGIKVPLYLGGK